MREIDFFILFLRGILLSLNEPFCIAAAGQSARQAVVFTTSIVRYVQILVIFHFKGRNNNSAWFHLMGNVLYGPWFQQIIMIQRYDYVVRIPFEGKDELPCTEGGIGGTFAARALRVEPSIGPEKIVQLGIASAEILLISIVLFLSCIVIND